MDAPPPPVRLNAVRKHYGDGPVVLGGMDLMLARGDFVSLIGPSGCGKSTVLKIISGLSPVTSGEVSVLGVPPRQARDKQVFIFQDATLLPWLTVRENVELPLRLRHIEPAERTERAAGFLRMVGLDQVHDYYPRQLSGGMKMRASLARALTVSPELMLLDEPFGALDEMTRYRLNEELLALRAQTPFTAVFVTHSVAEAVFLSNRIVIMAAQPGRIHRELKVEFDYPRRAELRESDLFAAKVNDVSRALHEVQEVVA